tara:strand:+ start:291 stop:605 length:315 start_codon:yes stop_codon:yes gene_type:complete
MDELTNKPFSKNAISHKELNDFLINAQKDITSSDNLKDKKIKEEHEFNDLIKDWTVASQKILLMMNNKDKTFKNNQNPKSLLAFGAMGAHINMALQALKAAESE